MLNLFIPNQEHSSQKEVISAKEMSIWLFAKAFLFF